MRSLLLSSINAFVGAVVLFQLGCGASGPTITKFSASAKSVSLGQSVLLSWVVENATDVELSPGGKVGNGTASTLVRPGGTTSYTLTASSGAVSKTSEPVTVQVNGGVDVRVQRYATPSYSGTLLLARVRDSTGKSPTTDTDIDVEFPNGDGTALHLTCPASAVSCEALYPDVPPVTGTFTIHATVDGTAVSTGSIFQSGALPIPAVIATRSDSQTVGASWTAVDGAVSYRITARNLDTQALVGTPTVTTATAASLNIPSTVNASIQVEAAAFTWGGDLPDQLSGTSVSRGDAYVSAIPGWQIWTPAQFHGDTLTVELPAVAAGEHIAVIPINFTTTDNVTATLSGTNLGTPPATSVGTEPTDVASASRLPTNDLAFHTALRTRENELIRQLPADRKLLQRRVATSTLTAIPTTTSFCVIQHLSGSEIRRSATLMRQTAHAAFYVDDADASDYTPYESPTVPDNQSIWTVLGNLWENTIYPTDTSTFGAPSDVDGNGKLLILFSKELGAANNGSIVLGYYYSGDVAQTLDTSASCGGTGANAADMFYLNGIANILPTSPTQSDVDEVIQGQYPDTLAHEFQHLINFNQHFFVRGTPSSLSEDTWINEGLAVTAEDLSGFGWHRQSGLQNAALYLNRSTQSFLRYNMASLTFWEADPIGNYEGSHTFFRLLADRHTDPFLGSLVETQGVGIGNMEKQLGAPFVWTVANWTSALLFSNETFSPSVSFNYTGAVWTPLHQKIASYNASNQLTRQGYLRYLPLSTIVASATLRSNGYNVFVSGPPQTPGQSVTLSVNAPSQKPYVVVARFTGNLPAGVPLQ